MKLVRLIIDWLLAIFVKPAPTTPIARPAPTVPQPTKAIGWLDICLPFTKRWEGCRLTAYWDNAGNVWTVGYGATGPDIAEGTMWTQAQADADLRRRLAIIGSDIAAHTPVQLTPNKMAALADFAYNEGIGRLLGSQIFRHLADRNEAEAMAELMLYDKAGGVVLAGLENRRRAEVALFNS